MEEEFRINKEYADKYNKWREKEELQKLKDRYGDVDENDLNSSSSESEDEDAEALTPQVERDWLRTLSAIKNKDPSIYNKSTTFYSSQDKEPQKSKGKEKKAKPVMLKDLERESVLKKAQQMEEGGDVQSSSDDEDDDYDDDDDVHHKPGYYEEQEELRKSLKQAVEESDSGNESEDIFSIRLKTKEEQEREEAEYLEWLKGQRSAVAGDEDVVKELEPLKDYINKPDLEDNEKFVWNYILNKQYLESDDKIPTYDEVTGNFSEEEETLKKQDDFERGVNFRYEDPDPDFIKRYPRFVEDSVRRKDTSRAAKRNEVRQRKQLEKEKKKEELKRLKNLKKKEISEKIEHLKEVTGNPYVGFTEQDLTDDFDPNRHDELMKRLFDNDFYETNAEYEKPVFSDDEDIDFQEENWDAWEGGEGDVSHDHEAAHTSHQSDDPHCEDPDFIMDADYDPNSVHAVIKETSKKKKRKSKFAQVMEKKKPVFNPEEGDLDSYIDEYYALDYEDLIGDLPCRFKYRKTLANDFGLTADEVLTAKDKELNQWVSLKKMSQYRTEEEEEWEKRLYKKKSRNEQKKLNILTSLTQNEEPEEETKQKKKRRKKKKKQGVMPPEESDSTQPPLQLEPVVASEGSKSLAPKSLLNSERLNDSKAVLKSGKGNKRKRTGSNERDTEHVNKKPLVSLSVISKIASAKSSKAKDKISKESKKKKKKKKPVDTAKSLSDERLKAYGINPKKFKYTYGKGKTK